MCPSQRTTAVVVLPHPLVIGITHALVLMRMTEGAIALENGVGHTPGLSDETEKEVDQGAALTRTAETADHPAVHENAFPSRTTTVRVRIEIAVETVAVLVLVVALSAKGTEAAPNLDGKEAGPGIGPRSGIVAGLGLVKNATSRVSPAVPRHVPRDATGLGRPVLAQKGKTEAVRECERIAASAAAP